MNEASKNLSSALWRIYNRPERPSPWADGGNLPWDDPAFSQRMLREHLDESHGAASRQTHERVLQIDWLWGQLGLAAGMRLLDVTCGPGLYAVPLAQRGINVVGIDFAPAAIDYANKLAQESAVSHRCTFRQENVHQLSLRSNRYDAAILLYGQLAVMTREQANRLLSSICNALKPGGALLIELLDQTRVDKTDSTWWFTDDTGLWGNAPFLHLGERYWNDAKKTSTERFITLHLETGVLDEIVLSDQSYAVLEMTDILHSVGFATVSTHRAWDNLPLYDAEEWIVYLGTK